MCVPVYIELGPSSGRSPCAEPESPTRRARSRWRARGWHGCVPGWASGATSSGRGAGAAQGLPMVQELRLLPMRSISPSGSPPGAGRARTRRRTAGQAEGGWCRRIYLRTEAKLNFFVFFLKEKLSPEKPRCKCSRWELSRLFFQICSHVATCPEQNRNRIAAQATPYLFI